ncbi:MAG TPA: NfeD family protein [Vicinamibacterales bacterium]|nr:NfeD family protein [Vicinamibacterales bacterium]
MEWWLWLAGGLALVVAELATPSGFFILFFGLGALTVGVLDALGIVDNLAVEVLLFTAISVGFFLTFRGRLRNFFQPPAASNVDTLVGDLAMVQEPMSPGVVGRVEVRGTMWAARNTSPVTLGAGQRARVAAVDGLTLAVIPE